MKFATECTLEIVNRTVSARLHSPSHLHSSVLDMDSDSENGYTLISVKVSTDPHCPDGSASPRAARPTIPAAPSTSPGGSAWPARPSKAAGVATPARPASLVAPAAPTSSGSLTGPTFPASSRPALLASLRRQALASSPLWPTAITSRAATTRTAATATRIKVTPTPGTRPL